MTAVMHKPGFIKVHDIAICLSFAFFCSQLCVFFPPRDAYSEDLKLSLHFIAFWKEKIVDSYRLRLGDQIDKFHMNLPKEKVLAVKKEGLRREEQQRIQREADMEAEQVRARELELEQEFNLRLERAVQERVRADAASRTGNTSRKEEKRRWTAGQRWRR